MDEVSHAHSQPQLLNGAPWGIHRHVHPSRRVTNLYTKIGDDGACGAVLVLIPQYDAGLAMLTAYTNTSVRSETEPVILDYAAGIIIPAL